MMIQWCTSQTGDTNISTRLVKPTCITDYNKYMGGVDRTDQLRGTLQNPEVVQEGGHPLNAAFNAQQLHCLSKS